jgi:hypothetical protein
LVDNLLIALIKILDNIVIRLSVLMLTFALVFLWRDIRKLGQTGAIAITSLSDRDTANKPPISQITYHSILITLVFILSGCGFSAYNLAISQKDMNDNTDNIAGLCVFILVNIILLIFTFSMIEKFRRVDDKRNVELDKVTYRDVNDISSISSGITNDKI